MVRLDGGHKSKSEIHTSFPALSPPYKRREEISVAAAVRGPSAKFMAKTSPPHLPIYLYIFFGGDSIMNVPYHIKKERYKVEQQTDIYVYVLSGRRE